MDIQLDQIQNIIYVVRGMKVMFDSDLAKLYGVETKRLNEQVRRNIERFPEDFMFQLTKHEYEILKSQFATSSLDWGGKRKQPLVFTENGVAMLSSVLKSKQAVQVNISIMRIFTKLKSFYALEEKIERKMDKLEQNVTKVFKVVFERLDSLEGASTHTKIRKKIGLKDDN